MTFIEGMTAVIVNKEKLNQAQRKREMELLLFLLLFKALSIAIVTYFLWPRVVPNIFTGVKSDPGFLNILGLSALINLML
jgi:hypothetical protein